jgi:hypothetical protein
MKATHKVVLFEKEYTARQGECDLFCFTEYWLEILPIEDPAIALFMGNIDECNLYYEENYLSYQA